MVALAKSNNEEWACVAQALMDKIRQRVDNGGLDSFRREAAAYMRGDSDAAAYYGTVASLGLSGLVPDMAALLPDPGKRAALLSMHSAAQSPGSAAHAANGGGAAQGAADADGFPSLGAAAASGSRAEDGAAAAKRKGGGAKKVPKFERLRLTGGDAHATQAWMDTGGGTHAKAQPQNAWTQGRPAAAAGGGGASHGQWSKQGKLASEMKAISNAWDKR